MAGRRSNKDKGLTIRDTQIAVILSKEEKELFETAASAEDVTASVWFRKLGERELKKKK